ncbi:MAG: hypothetical protein JST19_20510, partial [Bacteroidetes bacterium]|nr:hypothetical protein [Bacteroidota bacterium]
DKIKPNKRDVFVRYMEFLFGKIQVHNLTTGEVYNPADFATLSGSTITKYLNRWDSKIATHNIRSGNRQVYLQNYKTRFKLGRPKYSGSLISIDDWQPPFKTHDGKRIWFYLAIDVASKAIIAFVHGKTKEGLIIEFYRELVRVCVYYGVNLPAELECESSLNSSYRETFLREGAMFDNVRIIANDAAGKFAESVFRQFRYQLSKKHDEYQSRPFAKSESNQAGQFEPKSLYYDDIVQYCYQDIETWNNMPHDIHANMCRWDGFLQMQNPDLRPIDYKTFLYHIGYKTSTSCRTGIIKLNSQQYLIGDNDDLSEGDQLIAVMKRIEGATVDVYWIDDHNGKVIKALVYQADQLICEAVPQPVVNRSKNERTDADRIAEAKMSKYANTIASFGKQRKNSIDQVSIVSNERPTKKSFVIRGLRRAAVIDENAEVIILSEPSEEYEFKQEQSYTKPLIDRF